ncbi:MAG: arginyltransferase [Planctomycetes bacterium]|nr:arginyltransferase [Planctomycetota bacterium]
MDAAEFLAWVDAGKLPRMPEHPCSYLPERQARMQGFVTSGLDPEVYHELMDRGFRRSGDFFYAPDCRGCRRCVPIRVPVVTFTPSRSQRRALLRNRDVELRIGAPDLDAARVELYQRYLARQHRGSEQAADESTLRSFLYQPIVDTVEATYWLGERLAAVTILDVCSRSVSSVYHFFDPELARRSLGVYSVLAEIEWTKQQGIPHYYLGYWVEGARTMHYKADYRPHELWVDGRWVAGG